MSYGMDGWCKEISTQPYKGKLTDHIKREDAIKALCKSKCHPGVLCPDEYCVEVREVFDNIPAAQPEIVRCGECKHCEHWYADKGRCFLWHEDGISVFEDGFCNYAERRTDERSD